MTGFYRKRAVVIEAVQFTGLNAEEVLAFVGEQAQAVPSLASGEASIVIATLEGPMTARPGWWIIKGVQGEFYPCDPTIFDQTYDPVDG